MLPRCTARRQNAPRTLRTRIATHLALLTVLTALAPGCARARAQGQGTEAPGTQNTGAPTDVAHTEAGPGDPLHRLLHVTATRTAPRVLETTAFGDGPFDEVLPSWNVPHAGQPVEIDVRVRRKGAWTPWLRIGDWNVESRAEDCVTECDGARVKVDVLALEEPADACALRVTFGGGGEVPETLPLSAVLSRTDALEERIESAREEPWPTAKRIRVDVPRRSQRQDGGEIGGRICSPTSVAMTLDYFGTDVPTVELAHEIWDPHHSIFGNWNRAVQAAYDHGVAGELVRVSSWSTVAHYLENGQPLVASIRAKEGELTGAPYSKTAGHLLVVTGLAPQGGVYVNDPASRTESAVRRIYARDDMETVWFANGGVAYALGGRAEERP